MERDIRKTNDEAGRFSFELRSITKKLMEKSIEDISLDKLLSFISRFQFEWDYEKREMGGLFLNKFKNYIQELDMDPQRQNQNSLNLIIMSADYLLELLSNDNTSSYLQSRYDYIVKQFSGDIHNEKINDRGECLVKKFNREPSMISRIDETKELKITLKELNALLNVIDEMFVCQVMFRRAVNGIYGNNPNNSEVRCLLDLSSTFNNLISQIHVHITRIQRKWSSSESKKLLKLMNDIQGEDVFNQKLKGNKSIAYLWKQIQDSNPMLFQSQQRRKWKALLQDNINDSFIDEIVNELQELDLTFDLKSKDNNSLYSLINDFLETSEQTDIEKSYFTNDIIEEKIISKKIYNHKNIMQAIKAIDLQSSLVEGIAFTQRGKAYILLDRTAFL